MGCLAVFETIGTNSCLSRLDKEIFRAMEISVAEGGKDARGLVVTMLLKFFAVTGFVLRVENEEIGTGKLVFGSAFSE